LNIISATKYNTGDEFIIDPLLLPAFVGAAAAAAAAPLLLEEICVATKEAV
jgi:hypothetical protein